METVLAIDVGGTKLATAVVDTTGRLISEHRTPTPPDGDAEAIWSALVAGIEAALDGAGRPQLEAIGTGCGGPMHWPSGVVSPLTMRGWVEFPLRSRLQEQFGVPVRLHNDAVCVAAAEHWRGAGQGRANMLGMVVSTGVGGGLILGGQLHDGATGNGGHIGHVVVDPDGPPCRCGGHGCLEAVARGPAVAEWAVQHGWHDGEHTAAAVTVSARTGNEIALAALTRAGRAVGIALASTVALLDLEVVCIGGGLAQAGDLLFGPLAEAYAEHAGVHYARTPRVVSAALGQQAGLIGAAALVLRGEQYWHA
ncbi:MAG: ROK family protein [Actinomycetota bacterium]|nr:ROK family protein [Actinomycetota bacterium]